jgi:maltose alpha-D-glucosyltransferase/alpha-amylase
MAKEETQDPVWFKDAVIYELHVRAFKDSNADGIGDIPGLISKLDYLEDLGINVLWLLPFYPSPLKDDGYDVTDYTSVNPSYGTLADFKKLLKKAHEKGIRVVTELVLNHTSDQHPWFQRARKAKKGSKYRDFYTWSDTPEKNLDARIIFKDYESSNWAYDPEAKAYYWHRFYYHQPDLNYNNPEVRKEMLKVVDFWMKLGVDGLRLVNVPFLFEKEGTNSENLPETHGFIKQLRQHVERQYGNKILVAETNLWPEDAASYFGDGDEAHMAQYYPLMPRLFMALHIEDSFPVMDIVEQTPEAPENGQWALFLRNHDEMTLQMVTEEEKDYLYKAYGADPHSKVNLGIRRRLSPLLDNDRRKMELLYGLLFSLPGSPIIYYGDEIGMGDNIFLGDRYSVRTPMQWNSNLNAGFSETNPQQLYLPIINDPIYRHEAVNVANQQSNLASMLWWIKRTLAMRQRFKAFGRGKIVFIDSSNSKILSFARTYENQKLIIVSNLSKYSQAASLDLKDYAGSGLTEVFSQNVFPKVEDKRYPITIGPYGYFWFLVEEGQNTAAEQKEGPLSIQADVSWEKIFTSYSDINVLEKQVFPAYMMKCRWFGGKAKSINKIQVDTKIPVNYQEQLAYLLVLEVSYEKQLSEFYFLPVAFVPATDLLDKINQTPNTVICHLELSGRQGVLIDASYDARFRNHLFQAMAKKVKTKTDRGELQFRSGSKAKLPSSLSAINSEVLKADQSNTSIIYNAAYFFKFYRKIEKEINPDLEIVRFLSEKTDFKNSPSYAGSVELHTSDGKFIVFGLLQEMVDNQGEAWSMTMDSLGRYFDRIIAKVGKDEHPPPLNRKPAIFLDEVPQKMQELIGPIFYQRVVKLGQRTAEMHLALASDKKDPDFAPEKFDRNYQRALFSSFRKLVKERLKLLKQKVSTLPERAKPLAEEILGREQEIITCFNRIHEKKIDGLKTRIHGDYHLGQVLFTGKDFIIIDYEGEPGLSFSERRLKKNPFKDVAGMIRSYHYAAFGKIFLNEIYKEKYQQLLEPWAEQWFQYVKKFYLAAYLQKMGMDQDISEDNRTLLEIYTLEKAVYELGYELNSRPDWVIIPLRGIKFLIDQYKNEK